MEFNVSRPNGLINSQSLNNTQMTNSYYILSHWCLHKMQKYKKKIYAKTWLEHWLETD